MDKEQVQQAKDRAAEVVNGFKKVTDRTARDALKLAEACEAKDREIHALQRKLAGLELMKATQSGKPRIFPDIFGGL